MTKLEPAAAFAVIAWHRPALEIEGGLALQRLRREVEFGDGHLGQLAEIELRPVHKRDAQAAFGQRGDDVARGITSSPPWRTTLVRRRATARRPADLGIVPTAAPDAKAGFAEQAAAVTTRLRARPKPS